MKSNHIAAIVACSVLPVGVALMTHEFAHVLVGWLAGGTLTLITATAV